MNTFENYFFYNYNFNAIIISKIGITSLKKLPKIYNLTFFFIVNVKQYKKTLLLFYIIISLIFSGIVALKTNITISLQIIKLTLKKIKIFYFLQAFINFYLPLLSSTENIIKQGISYTKVNKFLVYRLNFFSFPVIPELDSISESYEMIYNFVSGYKFQLDLFMTSSFLLRSSNELIIRMYRFPCIFQNKKVI